MNPGDRWIRVRSVIGFTSLPPVYCELLSFPLVKLVGGLIGRWLGTFASDVTVSFVLVATLDVARMGQTIGHP